MLKSLKQFRAAAVVLLFLAPNGCGWLGSPQMQWPSFLHPGPTNYQQYNAVRYDPYPQDDLGPEVVGGRPRDYQKPPDTVSQVRQTHSAGNWRGHSQ